MNFNRKKHSRFIQYLDSTAEKNPLLWLPCVLIIALVLTAEHVAEYAKIAYSNRNTEKLAVEKPHLERRKPFFLRAVAVTLTAAFSLMLVPMNSFAAFGEEYDPTTEQVVFDEASEAGEITESEDMTVPEEPEEPSEPEEPTVPDEPSVPEETEEPVEITEPEETEEPKEEDFPREGNFVSENDFLLYGISTQAADHTGHKIHPKWSITNEEHWRYCQTCDEEFDREPHLPKRLVGFIPPTSDKQGYLLYQCICGFEDREGIAPTDTEHRFGDWESNDENHWKECQYEDCKFVNELAKHSMGAWEQYSPGSFYYSGYHYRKCTVCGDSMHGYIEELVPHDWGDWQKDDSGHWRICKDCKQEERANHNIPDEPKQWDYKYDKDDNGNHWLECSFCGYKKGEVRHNIDPDTWQHNNTHHRKGCTICMYFTEQEEHELRWEIYDDNQKHRQLCDECGAIINDGEHIWILENTDENEHWIRCRVCPETQEKTEHTFAKEWSTDRTSHWHECTYKCEIDGREYTCGYKKDIAAHTPDYDTWYGDENSHWRQCSECGHEVEKVKHDYKRQHDEVTHWDVCEGCGRKDHENFHSYLDPTYTYDEDGVTPIKIYECVDCDYSYTVPVWHEHTFFEEFGYNELGHWYDCRYCDGKIDSAYHIYSEKVILEPTETETGIKLYSCTACDYSYEATIPKLGHQHTFGSEWRYNESEHWLECTGCGEKSNIAPHVFDGGRSEQGSTIYTCTVCGYTMKTEQSYASVQVVPVPLRLPYITNDPQFRGWQNIAEYINASPDEVIIPITMNGEIELPKEIAECIMYRDVTLKINMSESLIWTVNGLDVLYPQTVNLRVTKQSNKIPASVLDSVISEFEPREYRLYHSGDFGFTAKMTLNVGKKYNNYYAVLYHYNTKTRQLEFVDESLVENKYVTFSLYHASYYAVAFNSIPMYDNVSASAGVFENSVPIETSAMPETGGVTIPAIKLPQIMKYSNKKRRYRILRKRRLDDLVFVF